MNLTDLIAIYRPGGFLSHKQGYEYRPQQETLATAIHMNHGHLMAEAGTGSGKTLAYLVPLIANAMQTNIPAVVATSTIALQEQLLKEAQSLTGLFPGLKASLLKGKAQYLCPLRLDGALHSAPDQDTWQRLRLIDLYHAHGKSQRSQMPPDALPVWSKVDASVCQQQCVTCPLQRARQEAQRSHLVIVSHALLLADRENKILPRYQDIVVDEAHRLEDVATDATSFTITEQSFDDLRLLVNTDLDYQVNAYIKMATLHAEEPLEEGEPQLIVNNERWVTLCRKYQEVHNALISLGLSLLLLTPKDPSIRAQQAEALFRLETLRDRLDLFFRPDDNVRWFQGTLRYAPLRVSNRLSELWAGRRAALVSATLKESSGFPRHRLGLGPGPEMTLESPFAYKEQCLLVLGDDDPREEDYPETVAKVLDDLYDELGGAILCLCTSVESMLAIEKQMKSPHLTQNVDGERGQLLERFKQGGTVLLGLNTFWEGVDLVGDHLQALVITRLPFDVPSDPLHRARSLLQPEPFWGYALPRCAMKLRQGFGRLIRSTTDRGVCLILDGRMTNKRYGRHLLEELPPCTIAHHPSAARHWFRPQAVSTLRA